MQYWKTIHEYGPAVVTEDANGTPLAAPWSTDVTLYNRTGALPIPFVIKDAGPQRLKGFRDHSCGQCRVSRVYLATWDRLNPDHVVTRDRQNQVVSQPHDYAQFQHNLERWWNASVALADGSTVTRLAYFESTLPNTEIVMDPAFAMRPIPKHWEAGTKESERQFELPAQHFWQTNTPKGAASFWSKLTALTLAIEKRLVWAFSSHQTGSTRHPNRYHNRGDGFGLDGRFAVGVEVWRRFKADQDITSQNHSVMWKIDVYAAAPALADRLKITIFVTNYATNKARVGLQGSERALCAFTGFFLEFILGPVLNMSSNALESSGYTRKDAFVTLSSVFVNSFGPEMNAIWAAEAPPDRRPRLAQAAAVPGDAPQSARPRLAPLAPAAPASPRPPTVTQPVTRLTAADVPPLDLTSLTTAKDAALAAAFQRVLDNSRTARGETAPTEVDSDADTDIPDATQAQLEAAYARIELIKETMLADTQLAKDLQAVEDAQAEQAAARAAARRQQYAGSGSSTEAGIPAAPGAAGQAPEAGTPAANPAAGQASRTVPSQPAAASGPGSEAAPAGRSSLPDPLAGLWPRGRLDPPAGPAAPQPAAPAPQERWQGPGLGGDTNYTSGSDNYSAESVTPGRSRSGWDDDEYRKGRGKGRTEPKRGSPELSPRPRDRGKSLPQQTLERLEGADPALGARLRTANQSRVSRSLAPLIPEEARHPQAAPRTERSHRSPPLPVVDSFRGKRLGNVDDWGDSWRSAPRPARSASPTRASQAPVPSPAPSPAPPVPPAPARVPKPVDAETVRQFVAPSLDEMLVADMAAREDAEGGFDQRNANTFNVKAYQNLVPRHLVDWGEPGSERPREETNELVTRLDTTVSVHVLPERRRALPLSPEEWVCRAAMDPNHPATAFDATTVPTLLRLLVPRRAAEVTVIDGDLANDNNRDRFGADTVTQQGPLQSRVPQSRQVDYVGPIVTHPEAKWNRVGDGRAQGSGNSSYVLWLTTPELNWLGALIRPGEIIRLHLTGIQFPTEWPAWPGAPFDEQRKNHKGEMEKMPWGMPVHRHPRGFPVINPLEDFWAQKERGFVTLRVTQDPQITAAANPQKLAFVGLEPPQARPKCRFTIAGSGTCECLHCRLQYLTMDHVAYLVGLHLAVVFRLEIEDVPVTLEGSDVYELCRQYKDDRKDRGAYRRKVTPAPVRRRSRSRSRSQSRAAARRRSRSREWRHPHGPAEAGDHEPVTRLDPSRPLTKIDRKLTAALCYSGTTGLARDGLTQLAEARTKELLQNSEDHRRVRTGPHDLSTPGNVLPAQRVSGALGLIAENKGDGETPAQFKPFLRDVTDIPDDQLFWPAEVRGREQWTTPPWHKWKLFCHPWNSKYSTNYLTQWSRYVPNWDTLCKPCAPGEEFKGDRGVCPAGTWQRAKPRSAGYVFLPCGMSHLCNYCVCPKDKTGRPLAGQCQGLTVVDQRGHTHRCCTQRDRCHGMWTHLGLTPAGDEIRYPLIQEALAAQQEHMAKQAAAAAAAAPVPSEEDLTGLAQNLLTMLQKDTTVAPVAPALSPAKETELLRSWLGVGRHPEAGASPTFVPYGMTEVHELAADTLATVKRLATDAGITELDGPSAADADAAPPVPVNPALPTAQLTAEELLSLVPKAAVTPADDGTHRRELAMSDTGEPEGPASTGDPIITEQPWYNQVPYRVEHLDLTAAERVRHSARTLARRFQATDLLFAQMSPAQRRWITVARVRGGTAAQHGGPADTAVDLAAYASRRGLVGADDAAAGWQAADALDSLDSLALAHYETVSKLQAKWRSYRRGRGFHWTEARMREEGEYLPFALAFRKVRWAESTDGLRRLVPMSD